MVIEVVSTMRNEAMNIPHFIKMIVDLRAELSIDLRAVVVDNGSLDNTADIISTLPTKTFITFLKNPTGSTYSEGIERAIAEVSSPYVLIVPGDLQFDEADILEMLKIYLEAVKDLDGQNTRLAFLTSRKSRTDGKFLKFRGSVWRYVVTRVLKIDSTLDPASQLKIIPTPREFISVSKNFIWDIEVLLWVIKSVTRYEVFEVSFKPRIRGKTSLPRNPLKTMSIAIIGLLRLSHGLNRPNSSGKSHFMR